MRLPHSFTEATAPAQSALAKLHTSALLGGMATLVLTGTGTLRATAQQRALASGAAAAPPLVFDGVTVVDVEQDKLMPDQRVVITGNRIRAVGSARSVKLPQGAQVVDARGKYLIPGLWDMHFHLKVYPEIVHPLLLAFGVTGIRDVGTGVSLDTLRQWRREILAGTRVGPPRQLFAGPMLDQGHGGSKSAHVQACLFCFHGVESSVRVSSPEQMRHVVDSLQAAGADFIKVHDMDREFYFTLVNEAHHLGMPFAGHLPIGVRNAVLVASDSGQRTIEHEYGLSGKCEEDSATVERCRPIAERHIRNGTWDVLGPTYLVTRPTYVTQRERWPYYRFWPDSVTRGWTVPPDSELDRKWKPYPYHLDVAEHAGLPLLVGTDVGPPSPGMTIPGLALHDDLAIYVDGGLTPLAALRAVTVNPAKMLHATDSLGTVAPGKLADLVLLDGNPLADITKTTAIRAVVANGRYFDRGTLDRMLADVQAKAHELPKP